MRADDGEIQPGFVAMSDKLEGFWITQLLGTTVRLGVADAMGESIRTCNELAAACAVDERCLFRLLRALQTVGVCVRIGQDGYRLSERGRILRRNAVGSICGRALFTSGIMWDLYGNLASVVRSGRPLPAGREGFARLATDPGLEGMHRAMVESSVRVIGDAIQVHEFGRYSRVLDVGGGFGGALGALLQRFPNMSGAVYDLSYLAEGAASYMRELGVQGRGSFIAGDFFQSVPTGFDCYLLKYIIHDWGDAEASEILATCAAAIGELGHLLLLERVLPECMEETLPCQTIAQIDLAMMTTGGKERTAPEYDGLLEQAGLRMISISPTGSPCSVIHAVPR
jgi:hypothetical protein